MRLGNNFSLTSVDAKSEEELQEASSEVELHAYSVVGTRVPRVVRWHGFGLFEDTSQFF
jgi:hypothetical protein